MTEKRKWNIDSLQYILKRDCAELVELPEKLHDRSLPKFKCGSCKTTIVDSKQFRNMDKYGCICSKCANIQGKEKREEKCLKEYGCKNPSNIPGITEKIQATRALNKGEDNIKENAKNMVNARWDKEKLKADELEKKGKMKCKSCNIEKKLECFTFHTNKTRGNKVYRKLCKECHNKKRANKRDEMNQSNSLIEFMSDILKDALRRDKKKNRENDIDVEYLLALYKQQNGKCYYSGRIMKYNMSKEEYPGKRVCPDRISIDRIDSNIGYKKGNIVLSTWTANNIKQDLGIDEFKSIVKEIYNTFVVQV
jgi:hypothetical protein